MLHSPMWTPTPALTPSAGAGNAPKSTTASTPTDQPSAADGFDCAESATPPAASTAIGRGVSASANAGAAIEPRSGTARAIARAAASSRSPQSRATKTRELRREPAATSNVRRRSSPLSTTTPRTRSASELAGSWPSSAVSQRLSRPSRNATLQSGSTTRNRLRTLPHQDARAIAPCRAISSGSPAFDGLQQRTSAHASAAC